MEEQHMEKKAELVTSSDSSRTSEARETHGRVSAEISGRSNSASTLTPNFSFQ